MILSYGMYSCMERYVSHYMISPTLVGTPRGDSLITIPYKCYFVRFLRRCADRPCTCSSMQENVKSYDTAHCSLLQAQEPGVRTYISAQQVHTAQTPPSNTLARGRNDTGWGAPYVAPPCSYSLLSYAYFLLPGSAAAAAPKASATGARKSSGLTVRASGRAKTALVNASP